MRRFPLQAPAHLRLALSMLVLAVAATSGSARVGENERELTTRYGPVVSRQPARKSAHGKMTIYGEKLIFRTPDWQVGAVIIGGRCEEISYTKEGPWTAVQFSFLLQLNGGQSQWTEQPTRNPDNHREWLRADRANAHWSVFGGFVVRTPAAERALEASS